MRITVKMLESAIVELNRQTNSPPTPWTRIDGRNFANIGNFHLYRCLGVYSVHRVVNSGGGATSPFSSDSARGLLDMIRAALTGIRLAREE